MAIVKATITIQKNLLQQADEIARRMKITRNRLFALAIEDFIRRYENKLILEQINLAYADSLDPDEQETLRRMRRKSIESLKGMDW